MKPYFKKFLTYGFILGATYGICSVIFAYIVAPGIPGIYEVGVQLAIVAVLGLQGSIFGTGLWIVVYLGVKFKRYLSGKTS